MSDKLQNKQHFSLKR